MVIETCVENRETKRDSGQGLGRVIEEVNDVRRCKVEKLTHTVALLSYKEGSKCLRNIDQEGLCTLKHFCVLVGIYLIEFG
jgi:thermostable 8-oxoguanine DNA glycosylase